MRAEVPRKTAAGLGWGFDQRDLCDDALPALAALRAAGLRLAVMANQPLEAVPFLSTLPVDRVAVSAAWRMEKPDPAFFRHVCDELGTVPADVAYVGDRVDNDVVPAKAASMTAGHLRRGPWASCTRRRRSCRRRTSGWTRSPTSCRIGAAARSPRRRDPGGAVVAGATPQPPGSPAAAPGSTGREPLDRRQPGPYVPPMRPQDLEDLAHLRRARDLMDRDHAQPLDVPAMARAARMSPAHFSRRFSAAYGETPYSYLMTRRIERAKALLRQGLSVTDTCFAVGCTSLGSFSSRFTEVVGCTPSQYRARDHSGLEGLPACVSQVGLRPRRRPPDS